MAIVRVYQRPLNALIRESHLSVAHRKPPSGLDLGSPARTRTTDLVIDSKRGSGVLPFGKMLLGGDSDLPPGYHRFIS